MTSNNHSVVQGFSSFEVPPKEENHPLAFERQLVPSFDFMSGCRYSNLEWPNECHVQDYYFDAIPLAESFPTDLLYASLEIEPRIIQEDLSFINYGNSSFGVWNELGSLNEANYDGRPFFMCNNIEETAMAELMNEGKKVKKSKTEEKISNSVSKVLTRQTVRQYFYMPITQAAKELNVGLTLLKKRCRELGIRRWPHRKLMSIQTLIKNVKDGKVEGEGSEEKRREAIEILERERKLLEEMPDMELEHKTKRLRQACFKANYKKRKLMAGSLMMDVQSSSSCVNNQSLDATVTHTHKQENNEDDDDEIKSLLHDSYSSDNVMV